MTSRGRDIARRFPGATAALFALSIGLGWFSVFPADASVTSDDGAYAVEVLALEVTGSWSAPHALAPVDEAGLTYPYQNSTITDEGWFPGARHAFWVRVLQAGHAVLGVLGMRAVPVASLGVAVWATARIASLVGGDARTAFLAAVLSLSSPLLFNSLQLWAHTPVAAAIGVAIIGSLSAIRFGTRLPAVLQLLVGVGIAAALRGDGVIFALAVGGALGLEGLRRRRFALAGLGAAAGAVALGSYLGASAYAGSFIGSTSAVGATSSRASGAGSGRLRGLAHTFFSMNDATGPFVLVACAALVVALAVWKARVGDAHRATALLLAGVGLWTVRVLAFPGAMASGLIGAWPIVAFAFLRRWRERSDGERHLVLVVAIGSIGIAATQYDDGGGLNWGGRFVAATIPALAVVVALGICDLLSKLPTRALAGAMACLVLATMTASLVADARIRTDHDEVVGRIEAFPSTVPIVTSSPPLPRLAWRTYPEREWLLVPQDDGVSGGLTLRRMLQKQGIDTVLLFGVPMDVAESIAGRPLDADDTDRPLLTVIS